MKKIAIIGAGISGLYIANLFKDHKDYQVTIYEKRNSIEMEEGYGIQLSVNSVKLLNKIGFTSFTEEEKFNPKKIDFRRSNGFTPGAMRTAWLKRTRVLRSGKRGLIC